VRVLWKKETLGEKNMSCENTIELVERRIVVDVLEELCARVGK